MAYTYLQLLTNLQMECDIAGVPPSDVTPAAIGATGDMARLAMWLNKAYRDIQTSHTDWGWMRKTTVFTTLGVANPIYTLAQCGITGNFGAWVRKSFRNYQNPQVVISIANPGVINLIGHGLIAGEGVIPFTTGSLPSPLVAGTLYYVKSVIDADHITVSATIGGAAIITTGTQSGNQSLSSTEYIDFAGFKTEIHMSYLDYDDWRDGYFFGALRTSATRPMVMSIDPQKSICLGPVADVGYTVVADYFSGPVDLVLATDVPLIPSQYQDIIIYKAMMYYGSFIGAPEVYDRGEAEFKKLMLRLNATRLPECKLSGAIA